MLHIKTKLATGVITSALLFSVVTPTFAATEIRISGNGSGSDNTVSANKNSTTSVQQSNSATISNDMSTSSNTGSNRASNNIRGNVRINSGDADSSVKISNMANMNHVSVGDCNGCNGDTDLRVSGNGSRSNNRINLDMDTDMRVSQDNSSRIDNTIDTENNSGDNRADNNSRGDVMIRTGDTRSAIQVSNDTNMNHVSLGGSGNSGENKGSDGNDHMNQTGRKLNASLTGAQEVPGPGDPDGMGWASVKAHPKSGQLCVAMQVSKIDPAAAAHIHEAPKGASGPVVVTLPTPNAQGFASGCITVDKELLKEIKKNPSDYYVNVHNALYPAGAVRGQLSK